LKQFVATKPVEMSSAARKVLAALRKRRGAWCHRDECGIGLADWSIGRRELEKMGLVDTRSVRVGGKRGRPPVEARLRRA
jgi:hypothetical protein